MPRVRVAATAEVPQGSARIVDAGGTRVALFHRPEGWFAIENTCTHRGGPLGEGEVDGVVVTCPWHGGQFDLRTGQVVSPPPARPVRAFPVVVEGDDVWLDLS
ncbi:MAG: non-heme iron oxygenase ferredoxin subunit [Armatimonadota bacterium]|nr:non-heme iron oxygenase ferredoxin subunit [Armatimonadota bacterium]MDR7533443.1 non-heme iron oxygenase ferredoxin subunit [Armatimonadota bacterium]MDR7536257.1 non-heme iron oxygenase ferredoxin subunit [Armatimonadota bacterium]